MKISSFWGFGTFKILRFQKGERNWIENGKFYASAWIASPSFKKPLRADKNPSRMIHSKFLNMLDFEPFGSIPTRLRLNEKVQIAILKN